MQKYVINIGLIVILTTFIFLLTGSGPLFAAFFTTVSVATTTQTSTTPIK